MAPKCAVCMKTSAVLKRPKTQKPSCKECFFSLFEEEIHQTICQEKLFKSGETIALGASGGKDSTVLIHVLKALNERYHYGVDFILISIDEGIKGYRDDSLRTVEQNKVQYKFPLKIMSYKELYGWSMDEIVTKIGSKNNCTVCGVFRRQALDRAAFIMKAHKIATGHNADDTAETIMMNVLRGDYQRLTRSSNSMTSSSCLHKDGLDIDNLLPDSPSTIPRCKPLQYCYEKEIVMYAHYKKLLYFATECTYATDSFRGRVRIFLKDIERLRPRAILDIVRSGKELMVHDTDTINKGVHYDRKEEMLVNIDVCGSCINEGDCINHENNDSEVICYLEQVDGPKDIRLGGNNPPKGKHNKERRHINDVHTKEGSNNLRNCIRCSYISSQEVCKACLLLEGLNIGLPMLGIGKTDKIRRQQM